MSIDPIPSHESAKFRTDEVPIHRTAKPAPADTIDPELVDQTKNQIRALVQEISDLAKSQCDEDEFYQGFLTRTTSALASVGGVIWTRSAPEESLKLLYHINLKRTNLADHSGAQLQHSQLLEQVVTSGEPTIIAPHSGSEMPEQAGNPTEFLLIFAPLIVDQRLVGLVEIFQRAGGGPATQRGYLRFLSQMAEIASDYLKTRRLRSFEEQQQLWRDLDQFTRLVHGSLDIEQTAYVIANEGRRIIGCDRVSVALRQGTSMRIMAVSGLDTIERRAEQIKRLGRLTTTVCHAKEPLWYTGDDSRLAPQIESQIHAYVDQAHSKLLAIIPFYPISSTPDDQTKAPAIGAILIEQLSARTSSQFLERRAELIAEHAESALANAVEHHQIPLLALWKQLAWLSRPFQGSRLPKTLIGAGAAVLLGMALLTIPYPFELGATGELIAETQKEIYAQLDGRLLSIYEPSTPDEVIPAGFELARMENSQIAAELERIVGELKQNQEQVRKLNQLQSEKLEKLEQITLLGDLMKAEENVKSLERELEIKQRQAEQLVIRSPIEGRLANWQLKRNLLDRPVQVGQNLMTVVAPDSQWQLEVLVPERRMGHLVDTQNRAQEPLTAEFILASNPGERYVGRIERIDPILDVYDDNGNSGRVLISFDNAQVPSEILRAGTRVTAKIQCGQRSIAYVWFHEVVESVQSGLLFWF